MANITQTVASNYTIQAWANKGILALRDEIVLAKVVARDTDFTNPGWLGKTINVRYPGTFTANDKAADTALTPQTPSNAANIALTLNKHKSVDVIIEDAAQALSDVNLADQYIPSMVKAIAEAVETDLFNEYSNLTGTGVGTTGTDITAATVRSAAKNMDVALAPQNDRYLVVSPKDMAALVGDSGLATYFAYAQNSVIETGRLPKVYGFNVAMSQLVPVVAGTPASTKNLAIHKNAFMLAVRPFAPIPQEMGVLTAIANDPVSGLSLRVGMQYGANNRGVYVFMDILYGTKTLRADQGLVVLG